MLLEGLLAYSCYTNKGCTEAIGHYYYYNPAVKQQLADKEAEIRNGLHPMVINYIIPVMGLMVNGVYHTSINGVGFELGMNNLDQKYFVTFKLSF